MRKLPQPIPYQGSKRNIASAIFAYLPPRIHRLVEPFAGSAALSIYAASHNLAAGFFLNDLNVPLVALLSMIINEPEHIAKLYRTIWNEQLGQEQPYYNKVRSEFNRTQAPELLLYLLARCVKAAVRYNNNGEFNQGPDNRRKGRHPDSMAKEIWAMSRLLRDRTILNSTDYRAIIPLLNPETDLVYMDPPYQGTSMNRDRRYLSGIDVTQFSAFLRELNACNIMYAISYDGHKGGRAYGVRLPVDLGLHHVEVNAGRSTQSTLLGENQVTYESLYLSRSLILHLGRRQLMDVQPTQQLTLSI